LFLFVRFFVFSDVGVLKGGVVAMFRVRKFNQEKRPVYRLSRIPFGVLEEDGVVFLDNIVIHIPDNTLSQIERNKF
jgi:hypothetical protein